MTFEDDPAEKDVEGVYKNNELNERRPNILHTRNGLPAVASFNQPSGDSKIVHCYSILMHNKMFGLRHFLLLSMVPAYASIGAAMFNHIEGDYEVQTVEQRRIALLATIAETTDEIRALKQSGKSSFENEIKKWYIKMLNEEDRFLWSTFDKLESGQDGEPKYQWTYLSAVFFCTTIFTTTGYGSIAPSTPVGRVFVILYALVTIPITYVVYRDCGQIFIDLFTSIYAFFNIRVRKFFGFFVPDKHTISLPILISFSIMILYIFLSGLFVYGYDALKGPPDSGLSLFISCYFSFLSITTIGFGDFMPNNAPFEPLLIVVLFMGTPIMRVVNRLISLFIERILFGVASATERTALKVFGCK